MATKTALSPGKESLLKAVWNVAQSRDVLPTEMPARQAVRVYVVRLLLLVIIAVASASFLLALFWLPLPTTIVLSIAIAAFVAYKSRSAVREQIESEQEKIRQFERRRAGFAFGSPTRSYPETTSQQSPKLPKLLLKLRNFLLQAIRGKQQL